MKITDGTMKGEAGFTLIEVAVASLIATVGLVFLANLFTLSIYQNRQVKQATSTVALSQEKLESLKAIEGGDPRLALGGNLSTAVTGYSEQVYVGDSGAVSTTIPAGAMANYNRFWLIEPDTSLTNTIIISVRTVAVTPSRGLVPDETTLTTIRSF